MPQFPLFAKIRFNPFDYVPLGSLHFAISRHHKRQVLQNFLRLRNAMFDEENNSLGFCFSAIPIQTNLLLTLSILYRS